MLETPGWAPLSPGWVGEGAGHGRGLGGLAGRPGSRQRGKQVCVTSTGVGGVLAVLPFHKTWES